MTTHEKVLYLKEKGFTISHLAKMVKCSPSTLNNWVRGASQISLRLQEDIEDAIETIKEDVKMCE